MIEGKLQAAYAGKLYALPEPAVEALIKDLRDLEIRILPNGLRRAMDRYIKLIAGRVAARMTSPWPGGTSARTLSRRSGRAVQSVRDSVKVEEILTSGQSEIIGRIGGVWYLRTHEKGAVIRAKRAKFLTIPLPAALNSQGIPLKKRARDWANTFIMSSKKGNLLIFQKRGGQIVPLYVLKKSVRIPKRLGMENELITYKNLLFTFAEQEIRKEFRI